MDVKDAIALGVQRMLVQDHVPLYTPDPIQELEHEVPGYGIEASVISDLETQIRVRGSKGVRYFSVKVTEHW